MSTLATPMPSATQAMALNDVTRHDIYSILERPVNLGTDTWASTNPTLDSSMPAANYTADTVNYLMKWDFPQQILTNSLLVVDKLKNYQYLKADIEIEIKVNAQPFLQGALMLVYNPYYNLTGKFRRVATRTLASQTSCPYKILNLEETNSIKLICPYANIYDLFDMANSQNQFGTVFLYVLSPLTGAVDTTPSVRFTTFARFINPQFFVPTQRDIMPSIQDDQAIARLKRRGVRFAESDVSPACSSDTGETSTRGPVSQVASGVTTVTDVLQNVPVIGKIASCVGWVARAVGATAAVFGLSKPVSIVPQIKTVTKPNLTMIHTEGNDDATTLALIQDNGIDGSSFIPETHDEMSLAYIFGRPNIFLRENKTVGQFSDRKLLISFEVSPFSALQLGTEASTLENLFLGSFAYTSMLGTLWRGTINFDVTVIKTAFHNGRFAIVYMPETVANQVPSTLGEMLNTNYNVVCNLKDRQDELGRFTYRIKVPFISNTPWRETYRSIEDDQLPGRRIPAPGTLETQTGMIGIYALTDLSFPPTVSDNVTFLVAHSGGEDYQIARPTLQLAPGYRSLAFPETFAESDHGPVFIPADENLLVPDHMSQDVTAQTTGEYFKSLRALIKRFGFLAFLNQSSDFLGLRTRLFTEDDSTGQRSLPESAVVVKAPPTPWYMVSFLYRFFSGSSSLKLIPPAPGMLTEGYLKFDEDPNYQIDIPLVEALGQPIFQQMQQISGAYEIRTPFYRAIRADVVDSTATPILGDVRTCLRSQNRAGYGSTTNPSYLYEAGGDDFNFFFLVGPPPMMDISNAQDVPFIPTVIVPFSMTVDLSNITVLNNDTQGNAAATQVIYNPSTIVVNDGTYPFITSTLASLPITYTDMSVENTPLTTAFAQTTLSGANFSLRIPTNPAKTMDPITTIAAWQAVSVFTVEINSIAP